ncbi:family 43 glycosylhydrolase [Sciscionella marina]|uniref:family 43 glycosylhydrolase n=1 Tax=Sciscionella marina TaxID=508770 RepID=UPI00035C12EF|nr:family 43 glycosylhydrolase [Sciscionella marina]
MRLTASEFRHVFDPSEAAGVPSYLNDHTIIRAEDGSWHLFSITHPEPANPTEEKTFLHARAGDVEGPWHTLDPALVVDPGYHGERHLWAPHVIRADRKYWMFYNAGGDDPTREAVNLATSEDLYHWTRHPEGPLFRDGFSARDPMVVWTGDEWTMYYCATDDPSGGRHVVAYRCSEDLVHWDDRKIAFTSERSGTGGGPTESPFVLWEQGSWYLFIGPCGAYAKTPDGYVCTAVYESDSPWEFPRDGLRTRIASHAAEVVDNRLITSAGWGQGGLYLADLGWERD